MKSTIFILFLVFQSNAVRFDTTSFRNLHKTGFNHFQGLGHEFKWDGQEDQRIALSFIDEKSSNDKGTISEIITKHYKEGRLPVRISRGQWHHNYNGELGWPDLSEGHHFTNSVNYINHQGSYQNNSVNNYQEMTFEERVTLHCRSSLGLDPSYQTNFDDVFFEFPDELPEPREKTDHDEVDLEKCIDEIFARKQRLFLTSDIETYEKLSFYDFVNKEK